MNPFLDAQTRAFYRDTIELLNREELPYLVGGAYAFERYTGIARHTKDFDIFIRRSDYSRFDRVLTDHGLRTELTFPHWLGKAFRDDTDAFIDLIFSGGNGIAVVDDEWFEFSVAEIVFEVPVHLCPVEEIIWSKSFVMERERFDGGDVNHLLYARADNLDWERLLRRFGEHWRVLLSHLILFGFAYPSERARIPHGVVEQLMGRFATEMKSVSNERICRGTLISRQQYLNDVQEQGFTDAREIPLGKMTRSDIEQWTAAIGD